MPVDRFLHPRASKSHKVTMLTDLEYRVWTQYLLSADDFGVMRATALALQNDNDHLANRPAKAVQRCLDALIQSGLIYIFTHQGKPYVYQHDWQTWQKVEYPRATLQPKPPDDGLAICDDATVLLFALHPGGRGEKFSWPRKKSSNGSEMSSNESGKSSTNAGARTRESANGYRLAANGLEGGPGETSPMDEWARELVNLYPPQGRCGWNLVERPLYAVLTSGLEASPWIAWDTIRARLEWHKRSHQWRVKQMIPRLDKWLREGMYLQELPEHPVATLVNEKTTRTLASGDAFVQGVDRGSR